mgnify:CR=1 FL=1
MKDIRTQLEQHLAERILVPARVGDDIGLFFVSADQPAVRLERQEVSAEGKRRPSREYPEARPPRGLPKQQRKDEQARMHAEKTLIQENWSDLERRQRTAIPNPPAAIPTLHAIITRRDGNSQ